MSGIMNMLVAAKTAIAAAVDAYFNRVTLLLPGDGTNGSQNNTFLDSSTNNFTITRNGNTTQGTFSPFSQTGWSNYFDGTDDYLSGIGSASSFNFMHNSSALFTFECWVYFSDITSVTIFDNNAQSSSNVGVSIGLKSDSTIELFITRGVGGASVIQAASTTAVSANTWTHIAITYDQSQASSNAKFYVNGVAAGTGNKTANAPSSSNANAAARIGAYGAGAGGFVNGYISNLRISNSIVYSSAFTPATSALTTSSQGASSVALLTCQDNRFIENSSNAFAITVNGNPSVQAFSPFAPTAAYSAATNGASAYFDGTGDYLTASNVTALNLYNTTNTVECWIYPNSFSTNLQIYGTDFDGTYYTVWSINSTTGYPLYQSRNGTVVTGSSGLRLNQWNHVVWGRSGTTVSIWVNGSRVANSTITTEDGWGTGLITIGRWNATDRMNGYLSGLRVVKGTDVYGVSNTTITVPTAPPTAITNTQLLLNFTNGGIIDATGKNVLETVGNAQISTTQSKFGGSSMYFDGSGDYLKGNQATNDLYAFQGDFTIEFWMYSGSYASSGTPAAAYATMFATSAYTGTGIGIKIQDAGGSGLTGCACVWYNTSQILTGTTNVANSTWTHIAVCRSGSTIRLFVGGTQQASATNTASFTVASGYPLIGSDSSSGGFFNGYLDDLRVTKGYARYTANFTPPTSAFALQ